MRQRIDARRNRTDTSNNWFRIGVLTATVLAPLIARWNDLRTSNRAQSLRELAAVRLSDARDQAAVKLAPVGAAANARLDEMRGLANARIGDARESANARFDDALDRLAQVRTPEVLQNVLPFSLARKRALELAQARQRRRRQTTILWLAGVGVGLAAAGVTAFIVARRRMTTAIEDEEPMVELPTERNLAEATVGKSSAMRNSYSSTAERTEISVPVQTYAGAVSGGEARYVGNIHTMIFQAADDADHLPAEENRMYFSTEDEARQAGYHQAQEPEASSGSNNE
jgi:hypothetical protein